MTEELSKRDIEALAEQNVGLLPEVQEAANALAALVPMLKRAQTACKVLSSINAEKSKTDDPVADATSAEAHDAYLAFKSMVNRINDLGKYS